jgi:hypothetical protein
VLSVLEAMGVAKEVRAARWAGVEPRPTREAIDKAASVFESRRISDRRRLAELLKYMNLQRCRVQMLRTYFGEDAGPECGLCDSCAGLDSEVFDPGDADARHSLHAATDFHGRTRRRRRRGADKAAATQAPQKRPAFATAIPEVMPATVPPPWVPPPESEATVDPGVWEGPASEGVPAAGEIVFEPEERNAWSAAPEPAPRADADAAFTAGWSAVRDANIRPFVEWIVPPPLSLPVIAGARGNGNGAGQQQKKSQPGRNQQQAQATGGQHGGDSSRKRRRHRRGRHRGEADDRPRGPRLPGVYNPGGD